MATHLARVVVIAPQIIASLDGPMLRIAEVRSSLHWHLSRNANHHMTTTANNLRAALKQVGFNTRMVTVRDRHCTLCVTIRDASVSLTKVKAIVAPFESVSRDHATGEILCGGHVSNHIISRGLLKSSELTRSSVASVLRRASTSANRD